MDKYIAWVACLACLLSGCSYREVSPGRYWINSHAPFKKEQPQTEEEKIEIISLKAAKLCGDRGFTLEGKPKFEIGTAYVYYGVNTTATPVPDCYYTQYAQCGGNTIP